MNLLTSLLTTVFALTSEMPTIIFEPKNFVSMLEYMGKGMLVIFVIIGVIILVTLAINKIFSGKKSEK